MFFIRYWYVRAKLALAPNRYTPAEKVALAHEDIDVAKTIILDPSKRVHAGRPDNSLSNNQLVEILQRIYNEDRPILVNRDSSKFKKSFWGKLSALLPLNTFPTYESLIPEYDANNLEANRKASESLVEMGLLDLKTLAPEHKVKLAKNSDILARKVFFGTDGGQNPVYRENLQPSHSAEIYAHYYAPVPAAVNVQVEPIEDQAIVPTKNFWERLIYDFIKPKINGFTEIYRETNQKIDAADTAIKLVEPASFNKKQSKKEKEQLIQNYKQTEIEQNKVKANAMREFYAFMDNPDKLAFKSTARLEICLYILLNSPNSVAFFKKHANEIILNIENNREFSTNFVAFLKSQDAKRQQSGEKLEGSEFIETTSLYNEVIKTFDEQIRVFLTGNRADVAFSCTLYHLPFNDIFDIYQSSDESKYFDNLLTYLSLFRTNEMQTNQDRLTTFLSVVTSDQLSKFLIDSFSKLDIFKLISKLGTTLTNEKYENLVKQLVTKLIAAQIVEMLFKNYKDAAILKFLGSARSHLEDNAFNSIVFELFNKYDSSQLLELISTCKDNEQQLSAIKTCIEIVEQKTKQSVIGNNNPDVVKFFMDNKLAAECLNIKIPSEFIVKTAVHASCHNDSQFINRHATAIIESAAVNHITATYFNSDDNLPALLKDNATVIDFPLQNIIEAQKFFTDIESYKAGGMRSYFVIHLELDDDNRAKTAKLLNCQPEKLQNALLVFSDEQLKNSFKTKLEAHGISFINWKEIGAHYTQPPFHQNNQFAEIMATPKNVIIPFPNPTHIYAIYKQFPDHALRSTDPFSKATHEAKGIIESVMKLGKSIADKIRQLPGIIELFTINFAPPAAIPKSAAAAATPPRKDQPKDADNKDKKEKDRKDIKSPMRTEASPLKPAANPAGNGINATSPARPPKGDNADLSPPIKVVTQSVGDGSVPAVKQAGQNGDNLKKATAEPKKDAPNTASSDESFDLEQIQRVVDETLAGVHDLTGENATSQPLAPPLTTTQMTGEKVPESPLNPPSTPAAATPAKAATLSSISSPMSSASPASASPSSALSPSQQNSALAISQKVDTIEKTSAWLKKFKANPEAYRLAFAHIKELTAKSFSKSELISFIAELDFTNRAMLLKQLLENNNLIQQIWHTKSGVIGFRTEGSELILEAANHDAELTAKLYPTKDFADKYHEYLNELKASQIIELLTKNWNNVLFRDILINFIHLQNKTLNLPRDNQEFATLLSTNLDVAIKILSRQTIVNSVFLSNFARNNIQAAIKLFRKDNTEQLSDAFLQQLSTQELNIVLAACWKDDEKRNDVITYLNSKHLSLTLYLDDKILAEHLVANLNYVLQHNLLPKDNVIPTFLRFGKDFIKQHWLKLFKFAVDNKCNIDANLFKDLTISKEDIAQLQSDYATIALDNLDKQSVATMFNHPSLLKSEFTLVKFKFNSENDRKKAAACLGCNPDQLANANMLFSSKTHFDNVLNKLKAIGLEQGNHFESIEIYRNFKESSNTIISEDGNDPISKVLGNNPATFLVPYPDIKYLAHLTSYLNSSMISDITNPVLSELRSVIKLNKNIYLKVTGRLYYFTDENKLEEIGVKSMLRPSLDHIEGKNNFSNGIIRTLPVIENDTKEAMQVRYNKADKDSTAIEAIQILIDDMKYQHAISPIKKLALLTKLLTERESDLEAGKNYVKWFLRNCQLKPSPVDINKLALAYRNVSREQNHLNPQLHDAYKKCLEFVIQNEDLQAALTNNQLGEIIREYIYLPNNIQYLFDILGLKFNAEITTDDIKLANKECVLIVRSDRAANNLGDNKQGEINAAQIIDDARKKLLAIYTLKETVFGKVPLESPIDFERRVAQVQRAADATHPSAQSRAATTLFVQPTASENNSTARSSQTFDDSLSDLQSSQSGSARKDEASFKHSPRANG